MNYLYKLVVCALMLTHGNQLCANKLRTNPMQVLIVGGGITGLSTAIALEKAGIAPDLVEKRKAFTEEGAGIAIPANATWALEQLGVDISQEAHPITAMQFTDDQGNVLTKHDITRLHPAGSQFYAADRSTFHKILLSKVHTTKISKGTIVTSLHALNNGKIRVKFNTKSSKNYDLVIGADGIHSSIRKILYPASASEYLGIQTWRTIISCPPDLKMPTYMLGSDKVLLLYPINAGKAYVYAHRVISEKQTVPNDRAQFVELFKDFGGLAPEALDRIQKEEATLHAANMETSDSIAWTDHKRNVLLLGDAAHAFGPMLQNGAAQGIEDAYVLGEVIQNKTAKDVPDILKAFIERRKDRVEWVSTTSNTRIKAITGEEVKKRNATIREKGAPNYTAFQVLMKTNP